MSPRVASEASEHLALHRRTVHRRARSTDVADRRRRREPSRRSFGCEPAAQVDLLVVHEVRRIEPADSVEVPTPYGQGGTQHPRHRSGRLEIEEGLRLRAEPRRSDGLPQTGLVNEQAAWRGEASTRGLHSTLPVDETGTHDPGVGMHVELLDERLHRTGVKLRVGVEDECVLAGACGNATVRCTAVADVRRRAHQARSWMISQNAARHFQVTWSCRQRSLPGRLWANGQGSSGDTRRATRAFRS